MTQAKQLPRRIGLVVLTCLSVLFHHSLLSQQQSAAKQTKWGVRGGLNIASASTDGKWLGDPRATTTVTSVTISDQRVDSKTGISVGAYVLIPLSDNFSFQPEAFFSTKSFNYHDAFDLRGSGGFQYKGTRDVEFSLSYLDLPLLGRFTIARQFALLVGPNVGF